MTAKLALALLLLIIASGALGYGFVQARRSRVLMRKLNSYSIAVNSAVQKRRLDLYEVRNRAKLLENTVSGGTSAVEKVHKAIANTTFGLVERLSKDNETRENALKARKTHDQTSKQVYHAVRTTNKAIHLLADSLFITKAEKRVMLKRNTPEQKKSDQ
ncbi:hypothetical protein [uncultured Marinobacter sp.]|uniref:hypothetical protein n=1 Tax=uncultured Marinobacter sp. TaxID=187379 RepID=UPI00262054C7|nr:hypothetical protein [uncultured Marinobacter sp.]